MSTISNERLEKLSEYDCADRYEVMSMATELLALRKEREKEESAVCPKCGNTGLADSGGVQPWGEPILIECDCTAPPAPVVSDVLTRLRAIVADPRALPRRREWISGQQYSYVLLENVEAMVDDACRAAILKSGHDEIGSWSNHKNTPTDKPKSEMSQKAEQLVRDTTALAVALSAETDTTSQQFESLAGKVVVTDEKGNLPCPFCGGRCDPNGWMGSYDDGVPMCGPECEDCGATASSIEEWNRRSTALAGKAVVPEGWKLVPIELTKEMLKQIHPFAEATCFDCGNQVVAHCADNVTASWNDMLAVAPEPCK